MKAALHIYRSASKGKPFTTKEKTNIILNNRMVKTNAAEVESFIAIEKNKLAQERAESEKAIKVRHALLANPTVKKINQAKDGSLYFQLRSQGKFLPRVVVS